MLLTHVVDLHAGERTIGQCLLDRKSRIVCMHVNLHDTIVRNHHDGISNRLKIRFERKLRLMRIFFFQ